jgi:hypothetical protein
VDTQTASIHAGGSKKSTVQICFERILGKKTIPIQILASFAKQG